MKNHNHCSRLQFIAAIFILSIVTSANAALFDWGGGMIFYTDLKIPWLSGTNYTQNPREPYSRATPLWSPLLGPTLGFFKLPPAIFGPSTPRPSGRGSRLARSKGGRFHLPAPRGAKP